MKARRTIDGVRLDIHPGEVPMLAWVLREAATALGRNAEAGKPEDRISTRLVADTAKRAALALERFLVKPKGGPA
jgi:hypothetical protein